MQNLFLVLIWIIFIAIPLRLQGPLSANGTGRVEVFYDGQWGTICDNGWDIKDARVACRELGYQYAVQALPGTNVTDGTGRVWIDRIDCGGSEKNLSSCSHNAWGINACTHSQDAGVECSSTGNIFMIQCRHMSLHES